MNIGINLRIDPQTIQYYESSYDILRTPDFNDKSRLLKPEHSLKKIGNPKDKKCRFCGKKEGEVSFKKIAHVFPEAIGNKALASNYECDNCNQYFGNTIENNFTNFFSLHNSIMHISGGNGIPKCKFKVPCSKRTNECSNYCIEISHINNQPCIKQCENVSEEYVHFLNNSITISKPIKKCCPIAIYKAIVKMAISVMPIEELLLFDKTIKWILEPEHSNIYDNKKLLVRYKIIPGFDVTKYPSYVLYRRKKNIFGKPYMLFNLTFGIYSLFIEVPREHDNSTNYEFECMPFPPIPFFTSTEEKWDFSQKELTDELKNDITLNFENIKDFTNN